MKKPSFQKNNESTNWKTALYMCVCLHCLFMWPNKTNLINLQAFLWKRNVFLPFRATTIKMWMETQKTLL